MKWRVVFMVDVMDAMPEVTLEAESEGLAVEAASFVHPWEAGRASAIVPLPWDAPRSALADALRSGRYETGKAAQK